MDNLNTNTNQSTYIDESGKVKLTTTIPWDRCKAEINEYPLNYEEIIAEQSLVNPHRVNRVVWKKTTQISVNLPGAFSRQLVVKEDENGTVLTAYYIAFNTDNNACFMRKIV